MADTFSLRGQTECKGLVWVCPQVDNPCRGLKGNGCRFRDEEDICCWHMKKAND